MRAVIQRVSKASVMVDGAAVGAVDQGLLILLGLTEGDDESHAAWLAQKIAGLRIFEDGDGKMNRSLLDVGGGALVISQFTLYGDCRKGRRPSFVHAAHPDLAAPLYERFVALLSESGVARVETGIFGAAMQVALVNDGPVTLILDRP